MAIADLDGDGRLDFVVANNDDPPAIYLNRLRGTGNWLRLDVRGGQGEGVNRDALGTRVTVAINHDGGQRQLTRWVESGSGYASQSDMRLHFGLADAAGVNWLEVTWPTGEKERIGRDAVKGLINCEASIMRNGGRMEVRRSAMTNSIAKVPGSPIQRID